MGLRREDMLTRIRGTCKECKTILLEFIDSLPLKSIKEIEDTWCGICPVCNKYLIIDYREIK